MDEELKAALSEAVKEGISPLAERLDALEERVEKSESEGDPAGDGEGGSEGEGGEETPSLEEQIATAVNEAVAELREEHEELFAGVKERLDKATRPASKAIVSQDGDEGDGDGGTGAATKSGSERDAFGRKRRGR